MKTLVCSLLSSAGICFSVHAADLSLLDDFGRPEIHEQYLLLGSPASSNISGIRQEGYSNSAFIDQSGGTGNTVQVWQLGNQSQAAITQVGSGNAVHLLQAGDFMEANLLQSGSGNQMAIQMTGSYSSVTGEQNGNGNRVVSVLADHSHLTFTQNGDNHLIQVDVGTGMSVTIVQP